MSDMTGVMTAIEKIEGALAAMSEKAAGEVETVGQVAHDTKAAVDGLGQQQRELAERLLQIEQRGVASDSGAVAAVESWGGQLIKSSAFGDFTGGRTSRARVEVKNTLTGSDATVAPDRKPGIIPGASQMLTLESLLPSMTTGSNAIEYTRESGFTNSAAETAENSSKPESSLTWELVQVPVSTIAHWIKISRQLASDNAALAAYVDARLVYGVNRRVETQLAQGTGIAPNLAGIFKSGNYTAHGYADGDLGSTLKKLVLIRKVIADGWAAGYPAEAILLNPIDFAALEIEMMTTAANAARVSVDQSGVMRLFGVPIVQSVGVAADTFAVGAFSQAYTIHNREGVMVEMSESDGDNFVKNLITVRAERRLALAIEVPGAVRGGDLTPAA